MKKKKRISCQAPGLTPVILATWEAEIRQIVSETLSRKYPTQKRVGGVAHVVDWLPQA
jgi:hypothetical protein